MDDGENGAYDEGKGPSHGVKGLVEVLELGRG